MKGDYLRFSSSVYLSLKGQLLVEVIIHDAVPSQWVHFPALNDLKVVVFSNTLVCIIFPRFVLKLANIPHSTSVCLYISLCSHLLAISKET